MADQLFALQADLNMISNKVTNLQRSYNHLDELVRIGHVCELEQLCQAAQKFYTIERVRSDRRFKEWRIPEKELKKSKK